jgi:hypothetical protein
MPDISRNARNIRIGRGAGAAALLGLLALSAFGFRILSATAQGIILQQTGVVEQPGGGLDIVPHQLAVNILGQRIGYTLRTAPGEVKPPAMPTGFPVYPGATIARSAVYTDGDPILRGVTYEVYGRQPKKILAWYAKALVDRGWRISTAGAWRGTRKLASLTSVAVLNPSVADTRTRARSPPGMASESTSRECPVSPVPNGIHVAPPSPLSS